MLLGAVPSNIADRKAADIALLVIGDDAPGPRVDNADQGHVGLRRIADVQRQGCDRAADRRRQLCSQQLPFSQSQRRTARASAA